MPDSDSFKRISDSPEVEQSPAMQRFLKSMKIGYIEWHDGIGYDLDALQEMTTEERKEIETLLISRKDCDWRDVEGLAALNTPFTIQALRDCLNSHNLDSRLFAVRFLKEMGIEDRIEEVVIRTLPETRLGIGMSFALNLIERYPSEPLRHLVLRCALNGNKDIRVHCAVMALYLYGKTKSIGDSYQGIVFDFHNENYHDRMNTFFELCRQVGVDPQTVLK